MGYAQIVYLVLLPDICGTLSGLVLENRKRKALAFEDVDGCLIWKVHYRDFAFFVFERRQLRSHLSMQRLSSEATTSYPNRDGLGLPEHNQRAAISFFQWSSNHKVINSHVVYADFTFATQKYLNHSIDKSA